MKKILFFAATALLFAACSNEEGNAPEVAQTPQAIAFDTYVPNATRAGAAGVMTTTTLQGTGFGVFAQQGATYTATTGANFMYNQQVTIENSAWTYTPLKYWPNETNVTTAANGIDNNGAEATDLEGLSFFAYAPYVADVTVGTTGITGMSTNTATTDPTITYTVATKPSQCVDLLWGVAPSAGLSYTNVANTTTTVAAGEPLIDLLKPAKEQKIKFLFKHALARLGMTVVAAVDQIPAGGTLSNTTKIVVNSVEVKDVTATKVLGTVGTLNLNNSGNPGVANWTITTKDFDVTINSSNELNSDIAWATSDASSYTNVAGVTTSEKNVINGTDNYLMVIPGNADTDLEVTIDYKVITADAKVSGGYVTTQNVIKKTVTIPALTNNKAYNLKLILGLTSVKLDAEVAEWEVAGSTEVDLPKNK